MKIINKETAMKNLKDRPKPFEVLDVDVEEYANDYSTFELPKDADGYTIGYGCKWKYASNTYE